MGGSEEPRVEKLHSLSKHRPVGPRDSLELLLHTSEGKKQVNLEIPRNLFLDPFWSHLMGFKEY